LSLQEGVGYFPGTQSVQEGMALQQPIHNGNSSENLLAPVQPLQEAYAIGNQYGMNNIYGWQTSTPSIPGPYNNEFVGFAVPPIDPLTHVPSDGLTTTNSTIPSVTTQPWHGYGQLPHDNAMTYWSQAYPQSTPHNGMFYPQ